MAISRKTKDMREYPPIKYSNNIEYLDFELLPKMALDKA